MFRRQLLTLTLLWIVLVMVCVWNFRSFSPEGQLAYQRLLHFSDEANMEHQQEEAHHTHQTRFKVSKQILYKKDLQRLQSRLASESSEVIFDPKGKKSEVVEHFKELTCAMQEKLIDGSNQKEEKDSSNQNDLQPKQYIRCLNAHDAIYSYQTGKLEAEEVDVAHYLIPGSLWPLSLDSFQPLLKGHAQKLQLSIFNELTLKAQGFRATFYEWGDEW